MTFREQGLGLVVWEWDENGTVRDVEFQRCGVDDVAATNGNEPGLAQYQN